MKKNGGKLMLPAVFFHLFRPFLTETSQQGEFFGLKSRLSFLGSRPSSRVRSLGTFRETHMSDISYTWEEYIDLNEKLVAMVAKSGWQFDSILCLSRGGMRPGDFFSRVYDMPLAVLATSSYREAKGTVQSDLDISDCITGVSELKGRVLLVDDMVDSGKTIREVIEHLKKRYPGITEIRVAVLWYKAHSVLVPDWHVEYLEDNPWIHQPFECYDALGPAKLIELVEAKEAAKKA